MLKRRGIVGLVVVGVILASCGGDDEQAESGAEPGRTSDQDSADDATEDATSDAGGDAAGDGDADDQTDSDDGDGDADSGDGGDADRASGGDAGDIDWATVDLSTIDWANIDLADLDLLAIEENPTLDGISDEDRAIIGERMAAQFGSGAVTLTVGDRTWEFDGFDCAFESSGLLNDGTTLGTNLFGEVEGVRIQMQIDVYDDGDAQFTMDDIEDFENPSVSYLETTDITVDVDGNTITASGDVTDQASESFDVVPMTFEGECGPGSIR